jgi:hypothetical protein
MSVPDPDNPRPKRKARAGVVIAAIVALIVVVTFVARNIQHSTETDENPAPTGAQVN